MKLLLLCDFKQNTIVCVLSNKDSAIQRNIAQLPVKISLKVACYWWLVAGRPQIWSRLVFPVMFELYSLSYKNLEIWKLTDELVPEIHEMTLTRLPKFEIYEEGSQIRRSSKSVKSTIVERYGRKRYKAGFVKFLVYAPGSNDETIDHLENLFKTKSLQDEVLYNYLHAKLEIAGKKINLL